MTVLIEESWLIFCDGCSLCRRYPNRTLAEEHAAEHDEQGCPGSAPIIDKRPRSMLQRRWNRA